MNVLSRVRDVLLIFRLRRYLGTLGKLSVRTGEMKSAFGQTPSAEKVYFAKSLVVGEVMGCGRRKGEMNDTDKRKEASRST